MQARFMNYALFWCGPPSQGCPSHQREGVQMCVRMAAAGLVTCLVAHAASEPCGMTRAISVPSVGALVRGKTYTAKERSGCTSSQARCTHGAGLDPMCASGAESCAEEECWEQSAIPVRFNSRTYLLSSAESAASCEGRPFGDDEYSCVDYAGGAYRLAGQSLQFDLELDYADCGCNAAV
jgi:hypothetical protein